MYGTARDAAAARQRRRTAVRRESKGACVRLCSLLLRPCRNSASYEGALIVSAKLLYKVFSCRGTRAAEQVVGLLAAVATPTGRRYE